MTRVSVYNSFHSLPKPYEDMFCAAGRISGIFFTLPWFRNLAETVFEEDHELHIYGLASGADDEVHLALPMCSRKSEKNFLRARRLEPAANYYTSLFGPILAEPDERTGEHLNTVVAAICSGRPKWDAIQMSPMAADSPIFMSTLRAFKHEGMLAYPYFCFGNWYLEVNNRSYLEYHDSLPTKLKNTLKRKTRQLQEAGRLRIEVVHGGDGLHDAVSTFVKIYSASWKTPEPHASFIPGLIQTCADQGWLRLGIAYIDNYPAAAQLWIVCNRVASIYKLAYDERFTKLSVGSILTSTLMEHVIDTDRVTEVDYLTGDEPYKRDWMSHRRERHGIVTFNPRTLHGAAAAFKHVAGRVIKALVRRDGSG